MGVKILVENASILTMSTKEDLFIDRGYIFINNGVIESVGRGETPIDLEPPDLVINGKGKLVIPGMIALYSRPSLLPLRGIAKRGVEEPSIYSTLTNNDLYLLSTLSLAGLAMRGITTILSTDRLVEPVVRASESVGIRVIAAPCLEDPGDLDSWAREISSSAKKWHRRGESLALITGSICSRRAVREGLENLVPSDMPLVVYRDACMDLKIPRILAIDPPPECNIPRDSSVYTELSMDRWEPGAGYGIGANPSWSLYPHFIIARARGYSPLDILGSATIWAAAKVSMESGVIGPGRPGDIVILDLTQPPWWVPEKILNENLAADIAISSIPRIEAVIVGGEIIVDDGGLLTVGMDLFSKAYNKISEILGRI